MNNEEVNLKKKSVLFLLILIFNLFILCNSSSILANLEAINDAKTDPTGDVSNAFVDIINATVSKNETYFIFSVFTLEEVPTSFKKLEEEYSRIYYGVRFPLLINNSIFLVEIEWDNQPWEANVAEYNLTGFRKPGSFNVTGSVEHIGIQLSVHVPTSLLGNSSEFEWEVYNYYSIGGKQIYYEGKYLDYWEKHLDVCPDRGVLWWEEPTKPEFTIGLPENAGPNFLERPIFGMPLIVWLIIIVGSLFMLYLYFKDP